ncbi:methyltransferase domain-containing protein [Nonomuraea sp. NPDC005692]|uniref:methyltransferase domain-containing protein n=1 Tax=Nonomuraea sp. NPDC005692 TaxID=3157168 RepID=UPI0034040932
MLLTLAVARAVRGTEPLVAAEIRRARLGAVVGVRHREVWFEVRPGAGLLGLRTADDVLLAAAVVDGVGHGRSALARLARAARGIDLGAPGGPDVEVSASFVGRRNYTRHEIEDAVGTELARSWRLRYHSRRDGGRPPAGATAWRVTIEGDQAVIARRAGDRPLHRRPYKTASIPGTLHPPLAAAMAQLAGLGAEGFRGVVLDPCCGAGTTLIEAHALAPRAGLARFAGFDRDPAAVAAAAANARAALPPDDPDPFRWGLADAGRLPVADGSVRRVLVNPPWGRQVPPRGLLGPGLEALWREVRRVLEPGGLAVALLHDDPGAGGTPGGAPAGFAVEQAVRVSLSGRHPVIAVLSRRGRAGRGATR